MLCSKVLVLPQSFCVGPLHSSLQLDWVAIDDDQAAITLNDFSDVAFRRVTTLVAPAAPLANVSALRTRNCFSLAWTLSTGHDKHAALFAWRRKSNLPILQSSLANLLHNRWLFVERR